jgi:DNA-binding NarL/FixJ family response regulator
MSERTAEALIERQPRPGHARFAAERPVCVWLVEDNHTFRGTVARVLNHTPGLDCPRQFSNSEDALAALADGAVPDVVLLDVELPGMNGVDAVFRMKAMSPATRIVMLTVFDDHDKIFRAVCAGASGYLLKTSPVEKIVESIRDAHAGGAPMSPRVARSVLDMFSRMRAPQHDYGLTERERKILELTTEGLLKKEIADRLSLSYHTVDTHLRNIYAKMHVHTRASAVAKAIKERLF